MRIDGERSDDATRPAQGSRAGLFVWGLTGFFVGNALRQDGFGAVAGSLIGVLCGAWRRANRQSKGLIEELRALDARVRTLESALPAAPVEHPIREATHVPLAARGAQDDDHASDEALHGSSVAAHPDREPEPMVVAAAAARSPVTPEGPAVFNRVATAVRDALFGGNTVVRVGVLVLLVGLTVLARWAVDNELFPVEARLATASLIGLR